MDPNQPTLVVSENREVAGRLAELGLTHRVLRRAVVDGEFGRSAATELHPPSTSGFNAWADALASLRNSLRPHGWRWKDYPVPVVINEALGIRIAVTAGDEMTGVDGERDPRTKNEKGSVVAEHVELNHVLPFYDDLKPVASESDALATWFLLIHSTFDVRSERRHIVRYELSRPMGLDRDGRISYWWERIVLPSIDMDERGEEMTDEAEENDFDVPVKRRE